MEVEWLVHDPITWTEQNENKLCFLNGINLLSKIYACLGNKTIPPAKCYFIIAPAVKLSVHFRESYTRSSEMKGDKSRESGEFLFSRRVPDFCDGRRSFPTTENSNLYRRGFCSLPLH